MLSSMSCQPPEKLESEAKGSEGEGRCQGDGTCVRSCDTPELEQFGEDAGVPGS